MAQKNYKISKRRDGRYEVISKSTGKNINGDAKVEALVAEGILKVAVKAKVEEPASEEATPAEESAE